MSEYRFLESPEMNALQKWHEWLDNNRGDRARLRRCDRPEDILLTDGFFHFLLQMPERWREKIPMLTSAMVAGVLSHTKSDKQTPSRIYQKNSKDGNARNASFAEQLATPIEGNKAPMSELRFQQLQKSQTTDDFYRRLLRAIRLLGGNVNILSLANDIIQWNEEFNDQINREPTKRLTLRWATDYFTALPKEQKEN